MSSDDSDTSETTQFGTFRKELQQESQFLTELHTCSRLKARHCLNTASTKQLRLLIKLFHHIASGDIPLKRENFEKIVRAKKSTFLHREFEREKDVQTLLASSRAKILTTLYKLQSVICFLLTPLKA
jgi:hypothetical protein